MYRQIIPTLLVILGLASWADAGFAASTQRPAQPVIMSTAVDADKNTMVVSGRHFGQGSAIVALGDRVLKVQSHPITKWWSSFPRVSFPAATC